MTTRLTILLIHASILFFCGNAYTQVTANFSADTTSGCSPLTVTFTNTSVNATSYQWSFGNGNNSTQTNPSANYITPNQYTVTLIACNGAVCDTLVKTNYITVFSNPTADIGASPKVGCAPLSVNFIDSTTPGSGAINQWQWDFGDGNGSTQKNPQHTYLNPGSYGVSLVVTDVNGCNNSVIKPNFIIVTSPTAAFTASLTQLCMPPPPVSFTNSSTGASPLTYLWNFGDGNTSTVVSPSYTYSTGGNFTVSLVVTDVNGCKDTLIQSSLIKILKADFNGSPVTGCTPLQVTFTNNSGGAPVSWQWDFGNGTSSSAQNPSAVTYNTPGTYAVKLVVSNGTCSDSITKSNYITAGTAPAIGFTVNDTTACTAPSIFTFTDTVPGAASYLWNFGDGDSSTLSNPSHTYNATGNYDVKLTVIYANGCTGSLTKPAYIKIIPPDAAFTTNVPSGCNPLTVQFTDSSTSGDLITSWSWDFGNAVTSTLQNPSTTYNDTGSFTVRLIIINAKGCTDTAFKNIYVGIKPIAGFSGSPLSGCRPLITAFTDSSSSFANSWYWDFGDGTSDTVKNPVHVYTDTGTFDVKLIVMNNGCKDSIMMDDYVQVFPPKAVFSATPLIACSVPVTVSFADQSSGADTWFWDFGNGQTFSGQNPPPVIYTIGGTYWVKLVVTNTASGCSDSSYQVPRFSEIRTGFIASGTGCQPLTVTFTDTSFASFGIRNWEWNFGDGMTLDNLAGQAGTAPVPAGTNSGLTSGTYQNPVHIYTAPGTYNVILTITDQLVCQKTDTVFGVVTVNSVPVAGYTANKTSGCAPLVVSFTDTSSSANPITAWYWNFGDSTTADTAKNPVHTYYSDGYMNVSLVVTDNNGCKDTLSIDSLIQVKGPVSAFGSNSGICLGDSIQFIDSSTSIANIISWKWDFGDGTTSLVQNPFHTYLNDTTYTVTLIIVDTNSCTDTLIKPNSLTVQDIVANFTVTPNIAGCPPQSIKFIDTSPGAVLHSWDFGDGLTSTLSNDTAFHNYLFPGSFTVALIATSQLGCKDTMAIPASVLIAGPNGTFTFYPDTGCPNTPITFKKLTATGNPVSFTWDFGDGTLGSGDSVVHAYSQPGVYHPSLILKDSSGCQFAVLATDSIVIKNIPVDAGFDTVFCESDSVTLNATGGVSFLWSPATGLSSTNIASPKASPVDTTVYYVTVTDINNCVFYDSVTVKVNKDNPKAAFSADTVCMKQTTQFTDLSTTITDSIVSWQWNFGDSTGTSVITSPSYTYTGAGTYKVKLSVISNKGCKNTDSLMVTVKPLPPANAGNDTSACIGISTQLNGSGGVSYTWFPSVNVSDTSSATPFVSPLSNMNYSLAVTGANGCVDTDTVAVIIYQLPIASAGADMVICKGEGKQLQATGPVQSIFSWTPVTGLSDSATANPVASPADTTKYIVTVTDTNKCKNTDTVIVMVNYFVPNVGITSSNKCLKKINNFFDATQITGDSIVSWNWNFGDGTGFSTDTNPNYTYSDTGTFTVKLIVVSSGNCRDTDSVSVTVFPLPVDTISKDTAVCFGEIALLKITGGIGYTWSPVSSLSNSSISNPVAKPDSSTMYYVIVTDSNACTITDSVYVDIKKLPDANAGTDIKICKNETAQLAGSCSTATSFLWYPSSTLSDSAIANPVASPFVTTDYHLVVKDINSCKDTDTVRVTVIQNIPLADFNFTTACKGEPVQFTDSSVIANDTIVAWNWNFGDGTALVTGTSPSHIFSAGTSFTVSLIVITNENCKDTVQYPVDIGEVPVAAFNADSVCLGKTTAFTDKSSISTDTIVSWKWNLGDASATSSLKNPSYLYPMDTNYTVTLIVTTNKNCTDTITESIKIANKPVADFTSDTVCYGTTTNLTDLSTVKQGNTILSWNWFINNNTVSTQSNPSIVFTSDGKFDVRLIVSSASGCSDTTNEDVVVRPLPKPVCAASPNFTDTKNSKVNFTADSAASYRWDFNDGFVSFDQNPAHSFGDSGTFKVVLKVANQYGCTSLCNTDVRVDPYIEMNVPDAFTPNLSGPSGGKYDMQAMDNDIFFPITRYVKEFKMSIYDRWGELVFESKDINIGWDGYYRGKPCQQDVYVYKIYAKYYDSKETEITKAGDLTLIR